MNSATLDIETLRPWLEARFSRSPGPGGQNVNKVNTRVTLLFDFEACTEFTAIQKERIRTRCRTRLSRDGWLQVVAYRERMQRRNREAAELRLIELLSSALKREKTRKATRPTRASAKRRLAGKRKRGELKQQRRTSFGE